MFKSTPPSCNELLAALRDVDGDPVRASLLMSDTADETWLPALREIMENGANYFEREAAAVPVLNLEGLKSLTPVLRVLRQSDSEGNCSSVLSVELTGTVEQCPEEAMPLIRELFLSEDVWMRNAGAWLLEYAEAGLKLKRESK